jgi:hypothetical protein
VIGCICPLWPVKHVAHKERSKWNAEEGQRQLAEQTQSQSQTISLLGQKPSSISAFETTTPHLSTSEKRQLQLANGYPTKLGLRFGGPLDPDSARDFAIYPQ